jgi:hypothetical protein
MRRAACTMTSSRVTTLLAAGATVAADGLLAAGVVADTDELLAAGEPAQAAITIASATADNALKNDFCSIVFSFTSKM